MTFDKNHSIQFRKTAILKFTSVPKKFPLNLLLSVLNFASVGGCFIEMNGSVGGSVEMKFTSIGGGSKFKVPSSPPYLCFTGIALSYLFKKCVLRVYHIMVRHT